MRDWSRTISDTTWSGETDRLFFQTSSTSGSQLRAHRAGMFSSLQGHRPLRRALSGRPLQGRHRPPTPLLSSTKLNVRLMKCALALQTYDFDIVHRAGVAHQNADELSRQEWEMTETLEQAPEPPPLAKEGEVLEPSPIRLTAEAHR